MMMILAVGELLGKSVAEIKNLPASELTLWFHYLKIKNEPKEEATLSDVDRFRKKAGV